jgi:hypothetical protein
MANQNTQPQKQTNPEKPDEVEHSTKKNKWDVIDENAWESFPASDAPANWAGRDIAPAERQAAAEEAEKKQDSPEKKS